MSHGPSSTAAAAQPPLAFVDSPYLIRPGAPVDLSRMPTDARHVDADKDDARKLTDKHLDALDDLQEVLYAGAQRAVLVVLQAIDAGGKDSTIRSVFGNLNPQGVRVASFKTPTPLELSHDFLWRYHLQVPPKGYVTVFNRSHYEAVIVERVKGIAPEEVWRRRYGQINEWERTLVSEGTLILKFFLNLSKKEQAERFRDRLSRPDKWWKFSEGDLVERRSWDDYQAAFADALAHCSTDWAPWYCVPADQKWYRNLVIAGVVRTALEGLGLEYPKPAPGTADRIDEFLAALDE